MTGIWKGAKGLGKAIGKGASYVTGYGSGATTKSATEKKASTPGGRVYAVAGPEEECEFGEEMGEFGGGEVGASNDGSLKTFKGHTAAVYGIAFAPGAERFVSGGADKTLRIWNLEGESGAEAAFADAEAESCAPVVRTIKHHPGVVLACDFSPTGRQIASCSDTGAAYLFDTKTAKQLHVLEGHTRKAYGICFTPTGSTCPGQFVATCSLDHTVRLWDTETGAQEGILKGHTDNVFTLNFSSNGRLLGTAGDDKQVLLWDWRAGKKASVLTGHNSTVWSVAFSHDDTLVATCGMGSEIKVWDKRTEKPLWQKNKAHDALPIHQIIFSADDQQVITGGRNKKAVVWEAESGDKLTELVGHGGTVYHLAMHPAGDRLLTSSVDRTMKLWSYPPDFGEKANDYEDAHAMP